MRQVSARSWGILKCLMKDPFSAMTAQQLARKLGVSERTIRYEVAALSDWLGERGIALERTPRKGFSICTPDVARVAELLSKSEVTPDAKAVYLSQDQRSQAIVAALLDDTCPGTLAGIAGALGVSRTTAARDMRHASEWLALHGVEVCPLNNGGWKLDVDEYGRRRAMAEFIEMGLGGYAGLMSLRPSEFDSNGTTFASEAVIERAAEALGRYLDEAGECLTDAAYIDLACQLSATSFRTRHGHYAPALPGELATMTGDDRLALASLLGEVGVPGGGDDFEHEIDALGVLLLAAPRMRTDASGCVRADTAERVMSKLLSIVSEQIGYDLYLDDELIDGLRVHIQALLARERLGLKAKCDLLPNIKARFPELFETCQKAMLAAQEEYGLRADDDEVGFVVMYVGAALERLRKAPLIDRSVRAVLVCGAGVGTVAFLSRSLAREFPHLEIVAKLSTRSCYQYDYSDADVVLTTVELPTMPPRPVIRVTPMLSRADVRKIEAFLRSSAGSVAADLVKELLAVVSSTCEIRDAEALERGIRGLLEGESGEDIVLPGLLSLDELVSEEFVQVGIDACSWEEAVAKASRPLLDAGWMTEDYYQGILDFAKRYEQYGVILAPLCAPHSEPDERNRPAISVVTLQERVNVEMSGQDVPVGVVMVLCLQTPVAHSEALDELFSLVDEYPEFISALENAETPAALIKDVCEYCRLVRH